MGEAEIRSSLMRTSEDKGYCENLLTEFKVENCKEAPSPASCSTSASPQAGGGGVSTRTTTLPAEFAQEADLRVCVEAT